MLLKTSGDQDDEVGEEYWNYHCILTVIVSLVTLTETETVSFQLVKFSLKCRVSDHISN